MKVSSRGPLPKTVSFTKLVKAKVERRRVAASARGRTPTKGGGIVDHIVAQKYSPASIVRFVEGGLWIQELEHLRARLDVPMEKLAFGLGISKATLHRRKATGKLDSAESDRVVRFARLIAKATRVFGEEEDARRWLKAPQFGLGEAVPLDYARTEVGAREVEDLLGRIEYGVYS